MKVCYVIAAWTGPRRMMDERASATRDPFFYIKVHLDQFKRTARTDPYVVLAYSGTNNFSGLTDALVGREPNEIFFRKNIGMSYGAFSDVYERFRQQFDYYIFVEDDYFPVLNGFDEVLLNMMLEYRNDKVAYLCGLVDTCYKKSQVVVPRFASISNGIADSRALEDARSKFNHLPYVKEKDYDNNELGQMMFTGCFAELGWSIIDWTDRYSSPFVGVNLRHTFGTGPVVFMPSQLFK
jgi:hypothetical protein